jgi:hypothetical protein
VPALFGRCALPAYGHAEVGPVPPVHYDGGTIPSDHYPVRAEIHY